jgi:hypothetical protein
MLKNPIIENRIGKFFIGTKYLEKEPNLVMRIMGKCIIVEAISHYHTNSIEYIAYSPYFEPKEQYERGNFYNIEVTEDEEGVKSFKFVKVMDEDKIKVLRVITF